MLIACVLKSGGPYTVEYVERLKAGVDANLSGHDFVCLSDVDVPCERIHLKNDWPGWYSKMELFQLTGKVLYFDLDTVITGDLTEIVEYPHKFTMLSDFFKPELPASGVMAWDGDYSYLMRDFYYGKPHKGHGDQGYIAENLGFDPDRFQSLFPNRITSRKQPQYRNKQESVVCFHGEPRPHSVGWKV